MKQDITSKNTSVNQIAKFYTIALKHGILGNAEQVFDYGCGRHLDKLNTHAGINNHCIIGYDPYNQTTEHNVQAMLCIHNCNMVVCNNVLNVLTDKALYNVIYELKGLATIAGNVPVYITVYEGNGTGQGSTTKKDCYQRNMKKTAYIALLKKVFNNVSIKYGIITCL